MDSKKWINDIREIKKYNDDVFSLKSGYWQVTDKITTISKYSSFFYDSHLDAIKSIVLKVLSEINPMFDLKPEDRFAAAIHGKTLKYSSVLRKGISETLAFLGVHGSKLINCTKHKPENTATLAIREIFKDSDWKLWASLNDIMPILAEAAPNEFLISVENALKQSPCPFDELFSQEGIGDVMGTNYMTGLYWALETLAWSEEYLARAILTLAELATHDPGGRYANRPANSISTVLLPWMPQTTAAVDKRIASVRGIQRNYPDVAWNILMKLLPNQHQVSSGSRKPFFRKYIPEDWKVEVPAGEYWEQVRGYAAIAVDMAKGNISHLSELVKNLDNIPQPSFDTLIEYISTDEIIGLSDEHKQPIWATMIEFIRKHRRYSDAKWVLPLEMIDLLEETSKKIKPSKPELLYRHLFSNRNFDFLDRDLDRATQQKKLLNQRIEAIKQIYEINKSNSVISFAENVENPLIVGDIFSHIANEKIDYELLPDSLDYSEQYKKLFISGYIRSRYHKEGLNWVNSLHAERWLIEQKCNLMLILPFEQEIWIKANELLSDHIGKYWKNINANPFSTQSSLLPAIESLLKYGRPCLAIDCIYAHYSSKKEFFMEHALQALIDGASSDEIEKTTDFYQIKDIIKMLQNDPKVDEEKLLNIEWAYLPLLNHHNNVSPKMLEKQLSQKPDFFIEAIKLLYPSENYDHVKKTDERAQDIASNVWKLLHEWRRPPGKLDDGSFSGDALKKWHDEVSIKTIESGYFDAAMTYLGHVLFYADPDPNGLWIDQSAAEILDEKDNNYIRQGFTMEVYNSRGVHNIDPSGKQEKNLADLWRKKAEEIENLGLIRFASSLKDLANSYDREAERVIADFGRVSEDV